MTYKIAFLTGSLYEGASGVRVVAECLSRELALLGHEVCVFGGVRPRSSSEFPESWNGASSRGYVHQGPQKFGFNHKMYQDVAAFNPDIVHLHGIWEYTSVVAMRLKRKTGATLVVSPHGSLAKAALSQSSLRKKLALLLYQNACFKTADGFHVTGQPEADELLDYTANPRISIVRNGVDKPDIELPAYHTRENTIIALCRMEPKKGLEELIAAWAMVEAERPDWSLEIRGPNRQFFRKQLEENVRERGLRNLHFHDGVYGAKRDASIASRKLFVLSSRNENFGITVAEALSLGTPVIASTGSPWQGLENHNCGWWVNCEPKALASAILCATETPTDTLMAMGERGQAWMEKDFHWKQVAQEITDFYKTLRSEGSERANPKDLLE